MSFRTCPSVAPPKEGYGGLDAESIYGTWIPVSAGMTPIGFFRTLVRYLTLINIHNLMMLQICI